MKAHLFLIQFISSILTFGMSIDAGAAVEKDMNKKFEPLVLISCSTFEKIKTGFPRMASLNPLFASCGGNTTFATVTNEQLQFAYRAFSDFDVRNIDYSIRNSSEYNYGDIAKSQMEAPIDLRDYRKLELADRVSSLFWTLNVYANQYNIERLLVSEYRRTQARYKIGDYYVLTCLDISNFLNGRLLLIGQVFEPLFDQCYDNTKTLLIYKPDDFKKKALELLDGNSKNDIDYYSRDLINFVIYQTNINNSTLSKLYRDSDQEAARTAERQKVLDQKIAREDAAKKEAEIQAENRRQQLGRVCKTSQAEA